MSDNISSSFAIGFVTGAVLGLAVSLIYTPFSGKELRIKMTEMVDDITARIDRFSHPDKYSRIKP